MALIAKSMAKGVLKDVGKSIGPEIIKSTVIPLLQTTKKEFKQMPVESVMKVFKDKKIDIDKNTYEQIIDAIFIEVEKKVMKMNGGKKKSKKTSRKTSRKKTSKK